MIAIVIISLLECGIRWTYNNPGEWVLDDSIPHNQLHAVLARQVAELFLATSNVLQQPADRMIASLYGTYWTSTLDNLKVFPLGQT